MRQSTLPYLPEPTITDSVRYYQLYQRYMKTLHKKTNKQLDHNTQRKNSTP